MEKLIKMLRLHKAGRVELAFSSDERFFLLVGVTLFVFGGISALVLAIAGALPALATNFSYASDSENTLLALVVFVSGAFLMVVMLSHALIRKVEEK